MKTSIIRWVIAVLLLFALTLALTYPSLAEETKATLPLDYLQGGKELDIRREDPSGLSGFHHSGEGGEGECDPVREGVEGEARDLGCPD